jgi:hypothetical protein
MDKIYCVNCKKIFNDDRNTRKRKYQLSLCKVHSYQTDKSQYGKDLNAIIQYGFFTKRKNENNETVGIFWKWINATMLKLSFDKIRYMDKYKTFNKFMINCPYCLSNDVLNATELQELMQNKKTCGLNQHTKEKEKIYNDIIRRMNNPA